MPAFSVITQDPTIRALVQDGMLERAFHDALFPALLYRADVEPILEAANVGDTRVFTGKGLLAPQVGPLIPGQDPTPATIQYEQWAATMQQWANSMDTYMPNAIVDIANLFLENAATLGLNAGQTMNRVVRDNMFNAALAGNTVADQVGAGGVSGVTTLHVARINGFTLARRPDLPNGSAVAFAPVSANNPLQVTVYDANGNAQATTVTGVVPDTAGDAYGPGTLQLGSAVNAGVRSAVVAGTATQIIRVSGGNSIDTLTQSSTFMLQHIRSALARFRQMNVRPQASGRFHCHLDPTSEAEIFNDAEWNRLQTSLPDGWQYADFTIGSILGTVFIRNTEAPVGNANTVVGGATNAYSTSDPFGGELWTGGSAATGLPVHRPLFTGMGFIKEYYLDMSGLVTEGGVTGKIGEPKVSADGIEVNTERTRLIIRAPLDRLQQLVSTSWQFMGAYAIRTDVLTGDGAAIKRGLAVEHA